jgi:hypothetical protein
MDSRISHLQAKASEVRQMAQASTIEHIRAELLKIAAQYDGMAAAINAQRTAKPLLRDLTIIKVNRKRSQ